jgi:hypothetical protein
LGAGLQVPLVQLHNNGNKTEMYLSIELLRWLAAISTAAHAVGKTLNLFFVRTILDFLMGCKMVSLQKDTK